MNFLYPETLLLIFVIILIYLFAKKNQTIDSFKLLEKLTISKSNSKLESNLIVISIILLILALARPVIEVAPIEIEVKQKDIVIAIDLSHSMSAKDLNPNRFEVAKEKLREFLNFSNNRHAILGFTSNALILSPPTSDKELLYYLFDSFDLNNIITKSTKIMPILEQTNKIIKSREKILIIFSDGGDEESFESEIEFAQKNSIKVFVLGVATSSGAMLKNEYGEILKDEFENIVVTNLNEKIKELAYATNGEFIKVTTNSSDVKELAKLVSKFEADKKSKERLYEYKELFYYFLTVAFILFFIATTTIKIKNFKILALISINLLAIKSYAGVFDFYYIKNGMSEYKRGEYKSASEYFKNLNSNEALFNLANSYYRTGEYELAIKTYKRVKSNDRVFKSNIFYNLANTLVKLKNYELAKKFYTNSLILNYSKEAYDNRELIKNLKKEHSPLQSKKKKKLNSKSKNDKNEQKDKKEAGGAKNQMNASSGGNNQKGKKEMQEVLLKPSANKRPFSYKEYHLINQGKVNEKNPW